MDLNDILKDILDRYEEQGDQPWDFLQELPVHEGLTYGDVLEIYVEAMYRLDRDMYFRLTDNELINLTFEVHKEIKEDTDLSVLPMSDFDTI